MLRTIKSVEGAMSEPIYVVHSASKQLTPIEQAAFSSIGIQERQDLEAWVVSHPEVLGEKLLVITSEFDRFDRSSRRLDVLALDDQGRLVVIELKLELTRTFADQQAIRYAAFCSTLTIKRVVELLAAFRGLTEEVARDRILEFLNMEELPELGNQPRIILAAGSLDDEELTSAVLWLRTFGVDITCVEVKPYRLPSGELILVPRTIIPLPEAKGYMISVEQKQIETAKDSRDKGIGLRNWQAIAASFNALGLGLTVHYPNTERAWLSLPLGHSEMHYEWLPLKTQGVLRVALHFQSADRAVNERRLAMIAEHKAKISEGVPYEFRAEPWGKAWATAEFHLPWNESQPPESLAKEAARVMAILVERTWPLVQAMKRET